jgi:mannose-6-phosphate isomerase
MPVLGGEQSGPRWVYRPPAAEFELSRLEWGPTDAGEVTLPAGLPRIMVCTEGAVCVVAGDRELPVGQGQSLWMPAGDPAITLRRADASRVQAFVATVGTV